MFFEFQSWCLYLVLCAKVVVWMFRNVSHLILMWRSPHIWVVLVSPPITCRVPCRRFGRCCYLWPSAPFLTEVDRNQTCQTSEESSFGCDEMWCLKLFVQPYDLPNRVSSPTHLETWCTEVFFTYYPGEDKSAWEPRPEWVFLRNCRQLNQ